MPPGPPDPEMWPVFVAELARVAGDLGVLPVEVPRDAFSRGSEYGKRWARFGTWTAVRRRAAAELGGVDLDKVGEDAAGNPAPDVKKEAHPFPVVPPGTRLKGTSTYIDGQWVKTEPIRETVPQAIERMLRDLPDILDVKPGVVKPPHIDAEDVMKVYAIGDHHLGMYAWGEESGEDWDLDLGESILCAAFDELVAEGEPATHALIIDVGDGIHVDNNSGATNKSKHPLALSGRWGEIAQAWMRTKVHAIERCLEHHNTVAVEICNGNHDEHTSYLLSIALAHHYHNEPRVEVSISPAAYRFHEWGKCLIGATHGDKCKLDALSGVMSNDAGEAWGRTVHRFWFTGHLHHTERKELAGCVAEIFRPLCPNDAYSQGGGWRSGRDIGATIFHREWGERNRIVRTAAYLRQRMEEARRMGAAA